MMPVRNILVERNTSLSEGERETCDVVEKHAEECLGEGAEFEAPSNSVPLVVRCGADLLLNLHLLRNQTDLDVNFSFIV